MECRSLNRSQIYLAGALNRSQIYLVCYHLVANWSWMFKWMHLFNYDMLGQWNKQAAGGRVPACEADCLDRQSGTQVQNQVGARAKGDGPAAMYHCVTTLNAVDRAQPT